jgi:predicted transcriptional regulator
VLGFFGVDEAGESVYRVLVGLGTATVPEIASRLGLTDDTVAAAMPALERLGLAALSPGTGPGRRYTAAPPALALGPALSERRHELKQAELVVDRLTQEYRRNAVGLATGDLVEVVHGRDAVRHRFEQLQLGAEQELLGLITGPPVAVSGDDNHVTTVAAARGVLCRAVFERADLELPSEAGGLAEALERGEQIRVADRVPTKLIIADGAAAMLPLHPLGSPGEPAVLVVRAGGLLEALAGLFESVWERSLPLHTGGADEVLVQSPEQPDHVDLQILSMLLAGLTDVSVAKQLDLGLRTVQRRVKRLLDLAGVTTRMQLGWHAREHSWVIRD